MMRSFFKNGFVGLWLLIALLTYGQNEVIFQDSTLLQFDTLHIQFPKSIWFNSYKFRVGDYATGKFKQGLNTTSHKSKRDYEEDKTTYKFTITLENNRTETALTKGEFVQYVRYVVTNGFLLEVLTGIESETTEYLSNSRRKTATITTSIKQEEPWELVVHDINSEESTYEMPSLLRSESRTILIIGAPGAISYHVMGIYAKGYYTFIENEVVIASVQIKGEKMILIQKDMDTLTRLVITSAIMAMVG